MRVVWQSLFHLVALLDYRTCSVFCFILFIFRGRGGESSFSTTALQVLRNLEFVLAGPNCTWKYIEINTLKLMKFLCVAFTFNSFWFLLFWFGKLVGEHSKADEIQTEVRYFILSICSLKRVKKNKNNFDLLVKFEFWRV